MVKKFEEFINEGKQEWIMCYVALEPNSNSMENMIGVYRSKNSDSAEVYLPIENLNDKNYFKDTHIKLQPGVKVITYFNLNML